MLASFVKVLCRKMLGLYLVGLFAVLASAQSGRIDSELKYAADIRDGQRIVGGWEAEDGQFPSTVSIRMVGPTGGVGACTGSILTNEWILTAAHCLARRFTYIVRLGQTNITRPGYMVEATERYIHENYDQESSWVQADDIGLLKLDHYIPYGDYIQPIRIQSSQMKDVQYSGKQLILSGYGRTDDWWLGGIVPDILYWVYQRGLSVQECLRWYPNSQSLGPQHLCSQYYDSPDQNACTGDSGGPLIMVDVDGKFTQVGIMSWGSHRGCNNEVPQGFVRPDHYHDWIEKQTGISFDWDVEELNNK